MIVPAPVKLPNGCIRCSSQKGPIWEGGVVTAMELTLYICRTCAELIARDYGLVDGPEMERLRDAAAELAQRDREATAFAQQMSVAATQAATKDRRIKELEADLEAERGKVQTMEHAAADVRTAVGTLVGPEGLAIGDAVVGTYSADGTVTIDQDPED